MATALDVAKYFLYLAKNDEDKETVSPLKLIKLSYFAYAWNLYHTGNGLFEEEIQAWQHGPVIPEIYHEYKHYKSRNINLDSFDFSDIENKLCQEDKMMITNVWNSYKRYSGEVMSDATHQDNTPWHKAYLRSDSNVILDLDIQEHYTDKDEEIQSLFD